MPLSPEEIQKLGPVTDLFQRIDSRATPEEIRNRISCVVDQTALPTANVFEKHATRIISQTDEISRDDNIIRNPHGVDLPTEEPQKSIFSWFFSPRCGGEVKPTMTPRELGLSYDIVCRKELQAGVPRFKNVSVTEELNFIQIEHPMPDDPTVPSEPGAVSWTGILLAIGIGPCIEAFFAFSEVILKRAFPLHHINIERMLSEIRAWTNGILFTVGVAGLLYTITGVIIGGISLSAIPITILLTLLGFVTTYTCRLMLHTETAKSFIEQAVDMTFRLISKVLKFANAPDAILQYFIDEYNARDQIHVGKCVRCEHRPRVLFNRNCRHIAYCLECVPNSHCAECTSGTCNKHANSCVCGTKLNETIISICDTKIQKRPCPCKGCIVIKLCGYCSKREPATVLHINDNTPTLTLSYSCKSCIDHRLPFRYSIPHRTTTCVTQPKSE